jgi:hypothetical protein
MRIDGETACALVRAGDLDGIDSRQAGLQIHRGRLMPKMAARSFADLVHIADNLGISMGDDYDECSCEFTRSRRPAASTGQAASKDAA